MSSIRRNGSFLRKLALALGLAAVADFVLYDVPANPWLMAIPLWCAVVLARPDLRRRSASLVLMGVALAFALLQLETASALGWCFFWTTLVAALLCGRASDRDNAAHWAQRLSLVFVAAAVKPVLDARRVVRSRRAAPRFSLRTALGVSVLPLAGGVVFLALFANANPLIETALKALRWPDIDVWRVVFWAVALIVGWSILRPMRLRRRMRSVAFENRIAFPGAEFSLVLSLLLFNAIFALQNGLDLAFLWSGAALPKGVSMIQYVHRGAYILIATALLAGLFVLMAFPPDAERSRRPLLRRLVVLWVAQNLLLVASSVLRTWRYVEAYLLTELRIAALAWMGLVAVGLVLIVWRLLRNKSSSWLINANVVAASMVLCISSLVDFNAVAAAWNVRHAREVGGAGQPLDLDYLNSLGDAAIVSLAELEARPLPSGTRSEVTGLLRVDEGHLSQRQSSWRTWTWRGMRRLQRLEELKAGQAWVTGPGSLYGRPIPPPSPPLTPAKGA